MNEECGDATCDTRPASPDAETLRTAIGNFPIVIFRQDHDLRYEWIFNSAMGFRADEVIGKTDRDLLETADDAENLERLKREVLETGVAGRHEVRVGRGALTRYYDLVITPSVDAEGSIDGVTCAAIDVTDRREAESALHDTEERLRLAIESARIGTWHYDVATDTLSWSDRCREIFGVGPDAPVTYERFLELIHPDDRDRTQREAEAAFHGENRGLYAGEYRVVRPDGATCWVIARGRAFFDDAQQPARFIGTVFDITDRKLNELALADAVRLRDETLAIVSHDLRTPLASIVLAMRRLGEVAAGITHDFNNILMSCRTFTEVLRRSATERRSQRAIQHIDNALRRGSSLTREILTFAESQRPAFKPVPLEPSLATFAEEIRLTLPAVEVVHRVTPPTLTVCADPDQLHRMLMNLAVNAGDAMSGGGTLTITARQATWTPVHLEAAPREFVEIVVDDTGAGMEPEVVKRMFEPQFTTKRTGTGWGLAIVQRMAQDHGGEVYAESRPAIGTTITILLPASSSAAGDDMEGSC